MNYSFCHMNYCIDNVSFISNPIYDSFRFSERLNLDCFIQAKYKKALYLPEKEPVFQNIQGLHVVCDGAVEYRYFRHFFTGEVGELLIDYGDKKELQILERDGRSSFTELDLINCCAFEKTMSEHGRFILHSSFIETDKGAVLFTAPSQTGKSTQADLWNRYRQTEIINGDRSGIWKEGDTWMAGGVPWCGTSGIMKNKIMPLRAVVILKQGPQNEIVSMRFLTKVSQLLKQVTVNPWNQKMLQDAQVFCMLLAQEVPVIHLSCLPDEGAVDVLEQELERLS